MSIKATIYCSWELFPPLFLTTSVLLWPLGTAQSCCCFLCGFSKTRHSWDKQVQSQVFWKATFTSPRDGALLSQIKPPWKTGHQGQKYHSNKVKQAAAGSSTRVSWELLLLVLRKSAIQHLIRKIRGLEGGEKGGRKGLVRTLWYFMVELFCR